MALGISKAKNENFIVTSWSEGDIPKIQENLEKPNWAPWLRVNEWQMSQIIKNFQKGQILIKSSEGEPIGSLSTNRIMWDGNPSSLMRWQDMTESKRTYSNTYDPKGNTLVMVWISVAKEHQGDGHAKRLISEALALSDSLGVDNVIGAFRPNEYGKHKMLSQNPLSFADYCNLKRNEDGMPQDAWLRNLTRNGMKPLKIDENSLSIKVPLSQMLQYRDNYQPAGEWKRVSAIRWECGEIGSWTIDVKDATATYQEPKIWGVVKSGFRS